MRAPPGKPVATSKIAIVGCGLHKRVNRAIELERQMAVNWIGNSRNDSANLQLMNIFSRTW